MLRAVFRRFAILSLGIAFLWAVTGMAARMVALKMLFFSMPATYEVSGDISHVETGDGGRIALLYLPNPAAKFTILYLHGNGSELGRDRAFLESVRKAGYTVAAIDYRGYGASPGEISEGSVLADTHAAMRWLREKKGTAPEKVILFGYSLGGGPAVQIAARYPVAGLVLQSTFTSVFSVKTEIGARLLAPFDVFRSAAALPQVKCPVLIFHGGNDSIIPFEHGMKLFAAAPGVKRLTSVPGANHGDLITVLGPGFWRTLGEFVSKLP